MNVKRFIFFAFAFFVLGCQKQIPQQAMWAGKLTLPEGRQLPFRFFLDRSTPELSGFFLNSSEQTLIPEIRLSGDSLLFLFSEYGAAMGGVWNGNQWRGKFYRYRNDTSWNEFIAAPVWSGEQHPDFLPATRTSLNGKYRVYSSSGNGIDSSMTANFWVRNDSILGTFIAPDGDFGLLAGTQSGSRITLSRFTGWQAFVLELEQQGSEWNGHLFARTGKPITCRLESLWNSAHNEQLTLGVTKKNKNQRFTFSGITSSGATMNEQDTLFRNKALLLDIMGTWCHNCMDAAPLLQQLYNRFNKDSLVVVGLSFELSDNVEVSKKNLTLFQKRYGITYPVLFCGSTKDANVDVRLRSQLNGFAAYPTTIFIDKKGNVRNIHVGFNGPGTGDEYQRQVQHYYDLVELLVK
jgi:thiol-disulfide isomerase/thioredoxin